MKKFYGMLMMVLAVLGSAFSQVSAGDKMEPASTATMEEQKMMGEQKMMEGEKTMEKAPKAMEQK